MVPSTTSASTLEIIAEGRQSLVVPAAEWRTEAGKVLVPSSRSKTRDMRPETRGRSICSGSEFKVLRSKSKTRGPNGPSQAHQRVPPGPASLCSSNPVLRLAPSSRYALSKVRIEGISNAFPNSPVNARVVLRVYVEALSDSSRTSRAIDPDHAGRSALLLAAGRDVIIESSKKATADYRRLVHQFNQRIRHLNR